MDILDYSSIPEGGRSDWLSNAVHSVVYLKESYHNDRIILYASLPCFFIHAVLVKAEKLNPVDQKDLARAHLDSASQWTIEHATGGGQPDRIYLAGPLSSPGCRTLVDAEQLVFRRRLEGVSSKGTYTEIDQKLEQALDLHYLEERGTYGRIDGRGDIEDVIQLHDFPKGKNGYGGHLVTVKAESLSEYMAVTDTALAIKFDFTRVDHDKFVGWECAQRDEYSAPDLFYRNGVIAGNCSFVNGWMVVRPAFTKDELIARRNAQSDRSNRRHAEFKIQDFRQNRLCVSSCSPDATTNYFEAKEGLPFELSPAFFRVDVLSKYKAYKDKYQIDARSIRCRSAWELRSYDINEAGQVHTYLIDLSHLPYEEQLYWQSFNEWPKAPISKRSYENDFKGEWTTEVDPLLELKGRISQLDAEELEWWSPRGDGLLLTVHYPSNENPSDWADEIMRLDQVVVEGFRTKPLKAIAGNLGATIEPSWGSLKIIEACLVGGGFSAEDAKEVISPLQTLHGLRSELKAHSAGKDRINSERDAIRTFKTYRAHYEDLAGCCDESLRTIVEFLTGHGAGKRKQKPVGV